MGQRISYFKNNFNKGLIDLIFEKFSSFRQWYLNEDKALIDEFNEPVGDENLKNYLNQNTDFKTDFNNLDKKLIDELTSDFICSYWEFTDPDNYLLEYFGPTVGKSRYDQGTEMVLATKDTDFVRLWNYIVKGRSLKDDGNFDSYTNEYKTGFLTYIEQALLREKIKAHFGPDPKISGLDYVLEVLVQIKDRKSELIIAIE